MMNLSFIGNAFSKTMFKAKQHSPEILLVTGVVGTIASAVMACKATTKVNDILEESKEQVEKIHEVAENEDISMAVYSQEDAKKDLAITYIQTGVKLVKLYAPSVALGVLSIGCILSSNNILRKRNIALAAAYTTVDKSFKEYRKRVIDRFGEKVDKELKYNIKAKKITETVVGEDGKEHKVKKTVDVIEGNDVSDFARFFDESSEYYDNYNREYNLLFLKKRMEWANNQLIANGYLFLNDVYEMLGIPKTQAGQVVGWKYYADGNHPNQGDNFVDFNIYNLHDQAKRDFVNGYEPVILLDFNVDGVIINDVNLERV